MMPKGSSEVEVPRVYVESVPVDGANTSTVSLVLAPNVA